MLSRKQDANVSISRRRYESGYPNLWTDFVAAVAICTQAPAAEKGATSAAPRSDHAAEVHGLARAPFVIPLRSGVADASNALPAQELMFGEPPVKLARNVVNPTLTAFLPETSHATGT